MTPPCLIRRRASLELMLEGAGHQPRQVDRAAVVAGVRGEVDLLDLLRRAVVDEDAVEVLLGRRAGPVAVEAVDDPPRQLALGLVRAAPPGSSSPSSSR